MYEDLIKKASQAYGLPEDLIAKVIKQESNFNPNAKSSAGAGGLMQLMPETAKSLGVQNVYDPSQNIMGGSQYLSQMMKMFNNDPKLALAAYNSGPGRVMKSLRAGQGGIPNIRETQNYVSKILGNSEDGPRSSAQTEAQVSPGNNQDLLKSYLDNFLSKSMKTTTGDKISGILNAVGQVGAYFGKEPELYSSLVNQAQTDQALRQQKQLKVQDLVAKYLKPDTDTAAIKNWMFSQGLSPDQREQFLQSSMNPYQQMMAQMAQQKYSDQQNMMKQLMPELYGSSGNLSGSIDDKTKALMDKFNADPNSLTEEEMTLLENSM